MGGPHPLGPRGLAAAAALALEAGPILEGPRARRVRTLRVLRPCLCPSLPRPLTFGAEAFPRTATTSRAPAMCAGLRAGTGAHAGALGALRTGYKSASLCTAAMGEARLLAVLAVESRWPASQQL